MGLCFGRRERDRKRERINERESEGGGKLKFEAEI